jgi:soluble lytic murein transglycosylase
MNYLKRYKYHVLAVAVLAALLLAGVKTKVANVSEAPKELPRIQSNGQLEHALELFPRAEQSALFTTGANEDQRPYILNLVKASLPAQYQDKAFEITRAVITEANHHHMDPLFLLAVIQTESQFNLKARGSHGEIGLMQILPETAKWIAPQAGVDSEKINLENPSLNIRIGATYFAQLRKSFNNKGSRYVSAYNMGSTNVRRLVKNNIEPYIYSGKVLGNYKGLYAMIEKAHTARDIASAK